MVVFLFSESRNDPSVFFVFLSFLVWRCPGDHASGQVIRALKRSHVPLDVDGGNLQTLFRRGNLEVKL